ncbi:MAG: McrBC 5-methylcytosine restriction system component-like protein [Bradyrhizobium sp.]|nr:McrBC 5-methylcytosine restriction system component-like protein [Bradyrhizobium sp.]
MKPDVAAFKGQVCAWILDTKWKRLTTADAKEGVAQSDLYQMAACATNYGCESVTLLYPHHDELGGKPGLRNVYSLYANTSAERFTAAGNPNRHH